jgi:hypothetical protein
MLPENNSHIDELVANDNHGTIIDGIGASEAIDTSAEQISLKGCDISSILEGKALLNSEHVNPDLPKFRECGKEEDGFWSTIVGRVCWGKKIFDESDCESQRELAYWNSVKLPFLYIICELFDNDGHKNAESMASIIRHYNERGLPIIVSYSVEGNTIKREGNLLLETVVRRIAATAKPANHSSISGLVAPVQSSISKSETEFIVSHESSISPLIKTLTLGSSNAAPSTLTNGAALSVEDLGKRKRKKFFKAQVLSAMRDWDKSEPFSTFLKHRLPEISDDFIDNFMNIMKDSKIIKRELSKAEVFEGDPQAVSDGLKTLSKAPSKANIFRGKHITPGEAEIIRGPLQGKKLKVFHVDDNHIYVEPPQTHGSVPVKVQKTPRKLEGIHYVINKEPEELSNPVLVDARKHAHPGTTESQEQKELIHGIDTSLPSSKKLSIGQSTSSLRPIKGQKEVSKDDALIGWYKSAHGKNAYVKPAVHHNVDSLSPGDEEYLTGPEREAIFHNMAHNYWGLGDHVPTTAVFNHPETGVLHSAMEIVPNASHFKKQGQKTLKQNLKNLGDNGTLDKLAIMDTVQGNSDRNSRNYLLSNNNPNIHLIDNALSFDYSDSFVPHYLHDYHGLTNQSSHEAQMHPNAKKWLMQLDPYYLGTELSRQGVHPKLINNAVSRLLSMQSEASMGRNNLHDIIFSHDRSKNLTAPSPVLQGVK